MDHERIAQLEAENATPRQRIADREALMPALEARLGQDSHTSHKPPSSDGYRRTASRGEPPTGDSGPHRGPASPAVPPLWPGPHRSARHRPGGTPGPGPAAEPTAGHRPPGACGALSRLPAGHGRQLPAGHPHPGPVGSASAHACGLSQAAAMGPRRPHRGRPVWGWRAGPGRRDGHSGPGSAGAARALRAPLRGHHAQRGAVALDVLGRRGA